MAEIQRPIDRLNYSGNLEPLVGQVCDAYGIGTPIKFSIIEVGYEDCNVLVATEKERFLAKMFSKSRTPDDIKRYTTVMQKVVDEGVNHPELMSTTKDERVYTQDGVSMVLMKYVDGKTFFELDRAPNDQERRAVIDQAVKVNSMDLHPTYLPDSWAIPNIEAMFDRVRKYVEKSDLTLVEEVMRRYKQIPVDDLPHCFVHGDFTKANVLKSDDGDIYILDFSVANWYPRIQELAVIAANLLHEDNDETSLKHRCDLIADEYSEQSTLKSAERKFLPHYALAGVAMEFMGSHQEKYINGNDTSETAYWLNLGRNGLRRALT